MEVNYKWKLGNVSVKKHFTDINGNVRTNAIKTAEVIYEGVYNNVSKKESTVVTFSLVDLSDFLNIDEINKELILNWAMSKMHPKEKEYIEKKVKSQFNDNTDVNNIVLFEFES